jgi:hypothetical protein
MRLDLVISMADDAITGLVVDSDNLPNFNRNDRKVYVNDNWDDNQWYDTAMVAFRDCS